MNRSLLLLALSLFHGLLSLGQSKSLDYKIDGTIQGMSSGKIYFSVFSSSGERDSAEITNGTFHFKGSLPEPSPVILSLERNYVNKPLFMFFVDKGKITVTLNKDDLNNGEAKGSAATHDYELLKSIEKPFNDQFESAMHLARDTSKAAQEEWEKIRSSTYRDRHTAQATFIKAHSSSPVAAWALHRNFSYDPADEATFKELYKILSPSLSYTSYGKEMKEKIEKMKMLAIGNVAPDFTQNDTLGQPVSLTDFRGKYVLLDFWASWCVPCRKDNPNVVKAFNDYKDKGFTVLSVSLDQPGKKEAWLAAIHKDGLTWTHVSDLKFWDNEVAKLYGIKAVPSNFLIDPNGKIVAHDLHGDEIEKTLKEIIK